MGDIVITPASNDVNSTAGTLNIRTSDSYPMLLKTSNVERISITAAGLVGIGTTAPTGKLHIYSSITGDTLLRADGTNGTIFSVTDDLSDSLLSVNNGAGLPVLEVFADDSVVMGQYGSGDFVLKNNKVGIGTTNPVNKLSVIGGASIGSTSYNVNAPSNGLIVEGTVGIGITNPNTNYKLDLSSANDGYARQWFASTAFVGTDNGTNGFQIRVLGGATNGLKISNAVNNTEYLRILSNGKIGIGTIAPTGFLTIQGNSDQLRLQTADDPASFYTYISSLYDSSHPFSISVANNSLSTAEYFAVYADAGGANNRIALLNGNVGIGTTVPTGLLNVTRNSNTAQPIAFFKELYGSPAATNILLLERGNNLSAANQISSNAGLRIRDHSSNYSLSIEDHNSNVNFAISGTRVLVGSTSTASLLNIGGAGSTLAASGITFGGDAQANLYRVEEDSIKTDGSLHVVGSKYFNGFQSAYIIARGTGANNSAGRYLAINGATVYSNTSRGLRLTIINATNLAVVSNTDYDTYGSDAACDDLAAAINGMTSQQIGVLTSFDAWERDRASLRTAALNVGLTKLGTYSTGGDVRKPYAAIFNGTSDTANATTKHVIERMESSDADASRALISTYITTDTVYAAIDGALHMPNALYASDADIEYPSLLINSLGNVGIGTTNPAYLLDVRSTAVETVAQFRGINDTTIVIGGNDVGRGGEQYITYRNADTAGNAWMVGLDDAEDFRFAYGAAGEITDVITKVKIGQDGNVGLGTTNPSSRLVLGSNFASVSGITVSTDNFLESQFVARKAASKCAFGVLAWEAEAYLSAGIYYNNGNWQQHNANNNNLLFVLTPGGGVNWYASNNGSPSWNVVEALNLWDQGGRWKSSIQSTRAEDSYILNGKFGIGTSSPTTLLSVGPAGSTSAASGITFGGDAQANLYRVADDTIRTDGSLIAVGSLDVGNGITSSSQFRLGTYLGYISTYPSIATAAYRWIILGPYNDTLTVAGNGLRVRGELFFSRGSNGENLRNARLKINIAQGYNKDLLHADVLSIDSDTTTAQPILYSVYLNGFTSKYFAIDASQLVSFSASELDASTVYYNGQFYDQSNDARALTIQPNTSITGAIGVVSRGGKIANALFAYTGNIGIGITVPSTKLEVNGPVFIPSTNGLYLGGTAGSFSSWQSVQYANNGYHVLSCNGLVVNNAGYSASPINAFTILTNTYDVGLSTNAPAERLHVYKTGLANNSTNSLLLLDGKFTAAGVDSDDIVGIAFRVENAAGGAQRTTSVASSYQDGGYNALLLQHQGGNVGIGTTNPVAQLHIGGTASNSNPWMVLDINDAYFKRIIFSEERSAYGTTGYGGYIGYDADNNVVSLGVYENSAQNRVLNIKRENGNVGIGTTNPSYPLHVANTSIYHVTAEQTKTNTGDTSAYATFYVLNNAGTSQLRGYLGAGGASVGNTAMQNHVYIGAQSNHGLRFFTNDTAKVTIQADGNVGIEADTPNAKLQIAGTTASLLTVGTLTNDWGGVVAIGTINGNGIILSKVNTANDANRVLTLMRDDTNGASIFGYTPVGTSTSVGFQIRASASSYFNGGNVGIGTTNPYSLLDVQVASASPRYVTISTNDGQGSYYGFGLNFRIADTAHDIGQIRGIYENSNGGGFGGLAIATRFGGTLYDRVTFTDQGRVGIGLTNPTTILSVGGAGSTTAASGITFGADSVANLYRISASRIKTDGFLTIDGGGGGATNLLLNRSSSSNENGMAFTTAGSVDWYYYVDNGTTNLQIQRGAEIDSAPRVRFNGANSDILFNLGGGNIGVGTATPTGKLHIYSTITGQTLIRADGTNGTIFSVVDDLSNSLLSVNNSVGIPVLEVFADDSIVMGQYGSGDLVVANNKVGIGTTNPNFKLTVNGDINILGTTSKIKFNGVDVINTAGGGNGDMYLNCRVIRAESNNYNDGMYIGYNSAGTTAAHLRFYANGGTERMRIQANNGFVGIGTDDAAGRLDVYNDINGEHVAFIRNLSAGSSAYSALVLRRDANTNGLVMFTNSSTRTTDGGAGNSTIRTDNGKLLVGAGGVTYHSLETNGNVGIGLTNPSAARLHIKGDTSNPPIRVETNLIESAAGGTAGRTLKGWLPIMTGANATDKVYIPLFGPLN